MTNVCPICNSQLEDGVRICPMCGYHVLDTTQSFAPVKMDEASVAKEVIAPVKQHFDLHEGKMSMGRDPRCDIFLNDMTVSRNHAELEVRKDGCILRDNNSYNGIWVNDRSVETCLLKSGDLIQIGAFCLLYRERA